MHQPPRQPAEPRRQALEHLFRQPGAVQDLAHPDEERQRGQRPRGARAPERLEQVHVRRRAGEELQPEPGHRGERDRDPHAADEQHEQQGEQDERRSRAGVTAVSEKSPARAPRLPRRPGRPACRLLSTAIELVEHGDEENQHAEHEAHLRDPDRDLDQALRHFVELPALVDEAQHRPGHVARRTASVMDRAPMLDWPAHARRQAVDQRCPTRTSSPWRKVWPSARKAAAAHSQATMSSAPRNRMPASRAEGLREHHRRRSEARQSAASAPLRGIEAVEEPPQAAYLPR